MDGPVVFINPNSDEKVTEAIASAATLQTPAADQLVFDFVTVLSSPKTIASDEDAAFAAAKVAEIVASRPDAAAFVIACFSDPGLKEAQSLCRVPVIGIQRAAILTALAMAGQFGVLALSQRSIPRHMREYEALGVRPFLAAERGLSDVSALAAGTCEAAFAESIEVGHKLIEEGARAIVLGCAGFSPRRRALQEALNVPVIDPVMAASAMISSFGR